VIAEVFEMKGGTVFEDWTKHRERLSLGGRVSQALADGYQRQGYALANAVKDVAKEQGVSPTEAHQAYELYVESEALRVQPSSKGSGSIQ
jgi:GNAT superfamily N-acetyltransferase